MITGPTTPDRLEGFLSCLQAKINSYYATAYSNLTSPVFSFQSGSKNIRIVCKDHAGDQHGSVYCFIEKETGHIMLPASWKAPARHPRGSIHADDFGMKCCGPHGVAYLK